MNIDQPEPPVVVEIVDAKPSAVKIQARDIRVGNRVFDTYGRTYRIVKMRVTRNCIVTVREDGVTDTFDFDETITVLRGDA